MHLKPSPLSMYSKGLVDFRERDFMGDEVLYLKLLPQYRTIRLTKLAKKNKEKRVKRNKLHGFLNSKYKPCKGNS